MDRTQLHGHARRARQALLDDRVQRGDLALGITTNPTPLFPVGGPTHVALYDRDGGV